MGDIEKFVQQIPKVELHCHLLGTVRRATFAELVDAAQAPITDAEIAAFYARGPQAVGAIRVLRTLERQLIRRPDDLYRLTVEYLQDAAAHHVRHAEFFWNPTGTARDGGIPYPSALSAIVRGIHDAQAAWGITGRLVPAIDREAGPAEAVQVVEWVRNHRCDEVVGIGIDYREAEGPPELFAQAFADARRAGLRTTAHAGEFGLPWQHVRTAVEVLQVDRIDHGYTVVDDAGFAARCAERGIVFTVVPTNSYYLRTLPPERWAEDHPIRHMPAAGLKVHPNTDDPTLHHVTPTRAWSMMVEHFGYDLDDLRACLEHGLEAAWIDDDTRRRWRDEHGTCFDALRARLAPGETPPRRRPA